MALTGPKDLFRYAILAPQLPQNLLSGGFAAPQFGQAFFACGLSDVAPRPRMNVQYSLYARSKRFYTEVLGMKLVHRPDFGFPGADDLGNMFQFKADFESDYCGARNLDQARSLNPGLQDFATWLSRNHARIPVE